MIGFHAQFLTAADSSVKLFTEVTFEFGSALPFLDYIIREKPNYSVLFISTLKYKLSSTNVFDDLTT